MNKEYLLNQLHEKTAKMRQHQKQFFKQKDKWNLEQSKKFEKEVDQILGMLAAL
jgi:hypothetical protein